jgi:hypothetical protein
LLAGSTPHARQIAVPAAALPASFSYALAVQAFTSQSLVTCDAPLGNVSLSVDICVSCPAKRSTTVDQKTVFGGKFSRFLRIFSDTILIGGVGR